MAYNGASFSYRMPAGAMATFTWPGSTTGTPPTTAPTTAPTGGTGQLTGLAGKCLDGPGAATTNGTPIDLFTCNGTAAQQWTPGTDGTLRALGKCLDVTGGASTDGTKTQLWDCTSGNSHQQWTYNTTTKTLINPATGKCLDVTGQSSADGTAIQIWSCNGQANQQWTLPD